MEAGEGSVLRVPVLPAQGEEDVLEAVELEALHEAVGRVLCQQHAVTHHPHLPRDRLLDEEKHINYVNFVRLIRAPADEPFPTEYTQYVYCMIILYVTF